MEQVISNQIDTAPQILFVDDEATAVKYFQRAINSLAPVMTATSVEEGKHLLDMHAETLLVLVSDQRMPGGYGNELLLYARTKYPNIVRILTTAYSELEQTVEAVNHGQIHRYIQKPWEIAAIRMELRQALDLANLRKEHAQLLREKMLVWKKMIISNRIGALYALSASLAASLDFTAVNTYLSAAYSNGITFPTEPDWHAMDYVDMVSLEAIHSANFGHAVRRRLNDIKNTYQVRTGANGLEVLAEIFSDKLHVVDSGKVLVGNTANFAEFLELRADTTISEQHVSWMAFLIWLQDTGHSMKIEKSENGIQLTLGSAVMPMISDELTDWIIRLTI